MEIADKPGKAARARQEDFRTVADSMPELISFIDAGQRYQFTNKSYEQWFSLLQEDFKGRLVREILGEDVYATVRPYIEEALTGEATTFEGYISSQGKLGRRYLHRRQDELYSRTAYNFLSPTTYAFCISHHIGP